MRSHHSSQRRLPLVACVACVAAVALFVASIGGDVVAPASWKAQNDEISESATPTPLPQKRIVVAENSGATAAKDKTNGDENPEEPSQPPKPLSSRRMAVEQPQQHPSSSGRSRCHVRISEQCEANQNDSSKQSFERVYKDGDWRAKGTSVRSGPGSTIQGAFDTITKLTALLDRLNITSVADVPCGDLSWQMAIPQISKADAYFGGDIADFVILRNSRDYATHTNKAFGHFNIVNCSIPMWYTDCDETRRPFEFVIVRDVIQHLHIDRAMKALRRIVFNSSATYLMITNYPSFPGFDENPSQQCIAGNISDGMWWQNRMLSAPWKLPPPMEKWKSHDTFDIGDDDWTFVYRIADLKPYVEAMADCPWENVASLARLAASEKGESMCRVRISQHCTTDESDKVKQSFERIYRDGDWLPNGTSVRSGSGSTIQGAFDTITKLTALLDRLNITSVADVPCGDLSWQMAIPQINAASAYFGGDIADNVVVQNAKKFSSQGSKVFGHMNIVECNIPMWYTDCDETRRPFEFVIVRDVIQHLHIDRGMKALRRIVFNSFATYLMITSYPSLPWSEDDLAEQCIAGNISDGMWWRNRMLSAPWKLPPPMEKWKSHGTFDIGDDDWTFVYRIADLKPYVEAIANCPWENLTQPPPLSETSTPDTTPLEVEAPQRTSDVLR